MTDCVMGIDEGASPFPKAVSVILVSRNAMLRARLGSLLGTRGCRTDEFCRPRDAACRLPYLPADAVLVDLEGDDDGPWRRECEDLLASLSSQTDAPPAVVITSEQQQRSRPRPITQDLTDFVSPSLSDDDLCTRVGVAIRRGPGRSRPRADPDQWDRMLPASQIEHEPPRPSRECDLLGCPDLVSGRGEAMRNILERVALVADKQTTVLITGETGTGKERIARALHAAGNRAGREFVAVNCAGIPSNLLEDEFFGHVKGAFTDAHRERPGRFEQASGGSIFLDEIGDLPLELQPKLLRVLQERELQRIGGTETIRVDARVIAATNADLWKQVEQGRFREDLFYRLNVFPIHLPALRERREEIPLLLEHFLDRFCRREGVSPKTVHPRAEADLMGRTWPGNIRELENAVETAVILSGDRVSLDIRDFPELHRASRMPAASPHFEDDYKTLVAQFERDLIAQTLEQTNGNKTLAAERLRLNRTTLVEKWKKLQKSNYAQVTAC